MPRVGRHLLGRLAAQAVEREAFRKAAALAQSRRGRVRPRPGTVLGWAMGFLGIYVVYGDYQFLYKPSINPV